MKNVTRRSFVLAAGGLGAWATSPTHAAQPGESAGKVDAAKADRPGRDVTAPVKAASASVKLTDDNMAELESQTKVFDRPWEGEFRAQALVLDAGQRICLVSLDSQNLLSAMTHSAARRIAAATGIPEGNVLICATHTHRGPRMTDAFGVTPNAEFVRRLEEGSVRAAVQAAAMGISLVLLGGAFHRALAPGWIFAFTVAYVASFAVAMGPVVWVVLSEIFPTRTRGRAMGVATVTLWIACFAVSQTVPWMFKNLGHSTTFWVYAAMCLVAFVFTAGFVPETKGKTLEETQRGWIR